MGSLFYDTGYYSYENPYYAQTTGAEYPALNYSQPIVSTSATPDLTAPSAGAAISEGDRAVQEFSNGNYSQSLTLVDAALAKSPSDVVLHEFRALVLFALQRYKEAASTLYAVLAVGPGWDWTTMSGLYPNIEVYTQQLRALEDFVRQNPASPDGRFVLAYHYMTAGHQAAAARQFQEVVRLVPNDQLARQLLALVTPSDAQPPSGGEAPSSETSAPQQTAPANLVGNWKAPTSNGGSVTLSLTGDGRFTWTYERPNKSQSFEGKYQLAGTTLVLEYSGGGTMVGKLNSEGESRFSLKIVGGPQNDPGLTFNK